MTTKRRNVSKSKSKTLSKSNKVSSSRKHLIKSRKNRLKTKKIKGGMFSFFKKTSSPEPLPKEPNSTETALINNTQLIGTGAFGCAFKKDNNIIKISLFTEENNNELYINKFLKDKNEKNPDLNLSQKISILINYAIYTYNKNKTVSFNKVYNGYNKYQEKILKYINKCNLNLDGGLNLNSIGDKKFLIQEMPNSGTSLSSYIETLLKNKTDKSYEDIIDILKKVINKSLSALKALHSLNIVHRDFHLDNILIDTQGDCRIIDFGKSSILTVKDGKLNPSMDEKNLQKFEPNYTPECSFLLDSDTMKFIFPNYIHIYKKTDIKTQIEKCIKAKEDNKDYFNSISNLFKLDLYRFGYELDSLLYPEYEDHYNRETREFNRNKPALELEGKNDYGKINEFIQNIANIDYTKRDLLYEIKI
jgi:serine/threonine protein kinase